MIMIGAGNIILNTISTGIHYLLLWIDSAIYWFASQCYQLFIKLASTRIFEDAFFSDFANRIYAILGVFMLFYLAYALLTALIDPEKFIKGDKGVSSIASNLVISLIILGFLPTIFNYAYRLQNYVLSSNLIGALIFNTPVLDIDEEDENSAAMLKYGDVLSFTVLNTFLNPENVNFNIGGSNSNYTWYDFKNDVLTNSDYSAMRSMNEAVANSVPSLDANGTTGSEVRISYMPIISTLAGAFLVYIMLSFTIDLGIRVIKFAFCQLIAPIPIIMRIIPGKKGTFDKWLKQTLSVYFEVFLKVGFMYMAIYFINAIAKNSALDQFWNSGVQGMLAFVIIIMGILTFAKQAPKMISDMLGIETGGLKLGIGEKLKAGGFVGNAIYGMGNFAYKNTIGKVQGGFSGAMGAMSTAIQNREISTGAAIRQGFVQGFQKGGGQFKNQRQKTFTDFYGYNKQQGLLGGMSLSQRLIDKHGKDVRKAQELSGFEGINDYENNDKFVDTFQGFGTGDVFYKIVNDITNSKPYSPIFDEGKKRANDFAKQHGYAMNDKRVKEVYNEFLNDYAKTTTDENAARAITSVLRAQELVDLWKTNQSHTYNPKDDDDKINQINIKITERQRDANIIKTTDPAGVFSDKYKEVQAEIQKLNEELTAAKNQKNANINSAKAQGEIDRAEWLRKTKEFTKDLGVGTISREIDGKRDNIYNEDYSRAQSNFQGGVQESDNEKLLRALQGLKK